MKIRGMKRRDIDAVLEIEKLSFSAPWSRRSMLMELNNAVAHYYVLLENAEVRAYIGLWLSFDEAHITNIAVHPEHRGRKLGTVLMLYAMAAANRLGAESMTLEVREGNERAQRMYYKLDFDKQGFRPRYYSDTGEGAYILWNRNIKKTLEKNEAIVSRFILE
ncbi:MAG: ribosomal protein S18-alanine N-acetyltransferase [Clostridia bacterium]|nr:ribosomal protein S18-alanine N-acetyltransferase [Clostridia bacterium]